MNGLPQQLEIGGIPYDIRSDYRDCITILEAFGDTDLTAQEKWEICLEILYKDSSSIPEQYYEEAMEQALWFLNCADTIKEPKHHKPVMDWKQDEQILFSAVNKVAGIETRSMPYLHFWTFIGYFNEIGEGLFSTVLHIRGKKNKGKKLDKTEQEFYTENKELIDLRKKHTAEDQQELDYLKHLLG